ncbi:hypothetical protein [Pseudoxanthomonas mexicana]
MSKAEPRPLVQYVWAALWLTGGVWFWYAMAGNPLNELALIRSAEVRQANLVDTSSFDGEDARGDYYEGVHGLYKFQVGGKDFYAVSTQSHSRFDSIALVEYLTEDPSINRVKGDGVQSVGEWLWRKLGLGLVFACFCLTPGVAQLNSAYKAHRHRQGLPA